MATRTATINAPPQPYDDIACLTTYLTQRDKPSAREQKEKLTADGHDALSSTLNTARPLLQRDADTTKENINGITKKFKQYTRPSNSELKVRALIRLAGTACTERYEAGKQRSNRVKRGL
jgi:hypothetical protein